MRAGWCLFLAACAARSIEPGRPEAATWQLVQHASGEQLSGDARVVSGPMVFLAPRCSRLDVLQIDPIPTQMATREIVRVRVTVLARAPEEAYRVKVVERSSHLTLLSPEAVDLRRGESTEFVVTSDRDGPARLGLRAFRKGGVE